MELTAAPGLEELVARARDGERQAWDDLVDRYLGLMHAVSRAHRLTADEAAEVNQVVWLRLVEHLPRLRAPEAVGGWIAATTRSECLRILRGAGRAVPVDDVGLDHADTGDPDGGAIDIDTGLLVYERDRAVLEAFGRLGGRCQGLMRLMMADPAPSYDEIAAALDIPVGRIGPTRGRCLEQLRHPAVTTPPPSHDTIAAELHRALATADPVPDAWRAAARASFAWAVVDAAPALLVYDSRAALAAGGARVGARALGPAPRELRFAAGTVTVEVELDAGTDEMRLAGRLDPARAAAVLAVWPEGSAEVCSDDAGVFRLDELPRRPLCLHVVAAPAIKTAWIVA